MINSYIKSLKLANHIILTIPSNLTVIAYLQPTDKPFNQNCIANQLSSFYNSRNIAESTKVEQYPTVESYILEVNFTQSVWRGITNPFSYTSFKLV